MNGESESCDVKFGHLLAVTTMDTRPPLYSTTLCHLIVNKSTSPAQRQRGIADCGSVSATGQLQTRADLDLPRATQQNGMFDIRRLYLSYTLCIQCLSKCTQLAERICTTVLLYILLVYVRFQYIYCVCTSYTGGGLSPKGTSLGMQKGAFCNPKRKEHRKRPRGTFLQ